MSSQRRPKYFADHPASYASVRDAGRERAFCEHADDGDTIDCFIDVGFNDYVWKTIRLRNFDAPENHKRAGITQAEIAHGLKCRDRVRELIEGQPLLLRSYVNKADKEDITLARYECDIWFPQPAGSNVQWVILSLTLRSEGLEKRTTYPAD